MANRHDILTAAEPPPHNIDPEGVAPALVAINRWIPWKWVKGKKGKWEKVPCNTNRQSWDAHDPDIWLDFGTAVAAAERLNCGIGFVFNGDGNAGVDLDDCRNPQTGDIDPWAQDIIDHGGTYTEVSPSKTGVKLFFLGELPENFTNCYTRPEGGSSEIYSTGRFFTVTGHAVPKTPRDIRNRSTQLNGILQVFQSWEPKKQPAAPKDHVPLKSPANATDDIETAIAALNVIGGADDYNEWIRIGQACKSVSDSMFQYWMQWSSSSDKFDADVCAKKWATFGKKSGKTATISTLCWLADQTGQQWRPERKPDPDTDLSKLLGQSKDAPTEVERVQTAKKVKTPDPGPFPKALLIVPGFVGAVMAHNLSTAFKPQPELALAASLALQAVLSARKITDDRGTRTNLQLLGICDSGGGKEFGRQLNEAILTTSGQSDLIGPEDIASDSGLLRHVELHPASLVQLDEIGKFLESMRNPKAGSWLKGIMALLLKLFSKSCGTYHGKAYADENKRIVIDQPCLVVYGTTVKESFVAGLTTEAITDGYLARQLVIEASNGDPEEQFVPSQPIPSAIIDRAIQWREFNRTGNLISEHPSPVIVPHDEQACEIVRDLNDRARAMRQKRPGPEATLWTRVVEKAGQLALVYAASRGPDELVIDGQAMRWAADVAWYLTERMAWLAYAYIAENEYESSCLRVGRVIREAGASGITTTELHLRTRWLKTKDRHEILTALIDRGEIVTDTRVSSGRPANILKSADFFTSLHVGDVKREGEQKDESTKHTVM